MMCARTDSFKARLLAVFEAMKSASSKSAPKFALPVYRAGRIAARLRAVNRHYTEREVELLRDWRNQNRGAFLTWITSTTASTRDWLDQHILARSDRILFLAELPDGIPYGQIGLTNVDFGERSCELDNWIRGKDATIKDGMTLAIRRLMDWVFLELDAESIRARVFSDNRGVLALHRRNGLHEEKRVALIRVDEAATTRWVEVPETPAAEADRQIVYLQITRRGYQPLNLPKDLSTQSEGGGNER